MCQGQCDLGFVFNAKFYSERSRLRVYKIPRSGIPHTSNAGCATLLVVFGECKYEHAGCATLRAWPLVGPGWSGRYSGQRSGEEP